VVLLGTRALSPEPSRNMFSSTGSFSSIPAESFEPTAVPATIEPNAKKPRQEEKHTCLPTTICAIDRAVAQRADHGGEVRFHGTEQAVLIVVGVIEALSRQSASMEFSLNDATGRMKARYYLSGQQTSEVEAVAPGTHVCVFGAVRTAPELHLAVTGMRAVRSADEVSFHMIEAAHAMLKIQRPRAEPQTPSKASVALSAPGGPHSTAAELSPPKVERPSADVVQEAPSPKVVQEAPAPKVAKEAPAQKPMLSGSKLRHALMDFLRKAGDGKPEGVTRSALCRFAEPAPQKEVTSALEQLVARGDLYTTIDDDHFQCI